MNILPSNGEGLRSPRGKYHRAPRKVHKGTCVYDTTWGITYHDHKCGCFTMGRAFQQSNISADTQESVTRLVLRPVVWLGSASTPRPTSQSSLDEPRQYPPCPTQQFHSPIPNIANLSERRRETTEGRTHMGKTNHRAPSHGGAYENDIAVVAGSAGWESRGYFVVGAATLLGSRRRGDCIRGCNVSLTHSTVTPTFEVLISNTMQTLRVSLVSFTR